MKALLLTAIALLSAAPAMAQDNPTAAQTQAARSGPCGDPWITIAYKRLYGDGYVPASWMCVPTLYANGRWGSFAELQSAVRAKDYGLYSYAGVTLIGSGPLSGRVALGVFKGGALVAAGGGNLVAAGGGNMVAAGGGNIILLDGDKLISPGPRTLASASSRPVPVLN